MVIVELEITCNRKFVWCNLEKKTQCSWRWTIQSLTLDCTSSIDSINMLLVSPKFWFHSCCFSPWTSTIHQSMPQGGSPRLGKTRWKNSGHWGSTVRFNALGTKNKNISALFWCLNQLNDLMVSYKLWWYVMIMSPCLAVVWWVGNYKQLYALSLTMRKMFEFWITSMVSSTLILSLILDWHCCLPLFFFATPVLKGSC